MWCLHLGFHDQWVWLDHCREDPAICICIIMQIRSSVTEIVSVCPNSFITQGKSTIVVSIYSIIKSNITISFSTIITVILWSPFFIYIVLISTVWSSTTCTKKCMVIDTHTSENDRVHQSNSHSEATLERCKSNIWWECSGCKSLCGFITYPSIFCGVQGWGSVSGADFHTATWKCARKTFSLHASLVGGTVYIARQHADAWYWYSNSVRLSVTLRSQMKTA